MDSRADNSAAPKLPAGRKQLLEIIGPLDFGRIVGLRIKFGEPCFSPPPRVIQDIKLSSGSSDPIDIKETDSRMLKACENLFAHLDNLRDGIVDIEIRHFLPFRLIIYHGHRDEA